MTARAQAEQQLCTAPLRLGHPGQGISFSAASKQAVRADSQAKHTGHSNLRGLAVSSPDQRHLSPGQQAAGQAALVCSPGARSATVQMLFAQILSCSCRGALSATPYMPPFCLPGT